MCVDVKFDGNNQNLEGKHTHASTRACTHTRDTTSMVPGCLSMFIVKYLSIRRTDAIKSLETKSYVIDQHFI